MHRRVAAVLAWTLLALILLDGGVGILTAPPADPRARGNALQLYFSYGVSIEDKLRRMIGRRPGEEADIVKAGWLPDQCDRQPIAPDPHGVSVYGMSFSNHIADNLARLDRTLRVRTFAGPGAPPNHSYACFVRRSEAGLDGNHVQIIGVLASSLRRMATVSGLTTGFEAPAPFTYPRYRTGIAGLEQIPPAFEDEAGLRRALATSDSWRAYVDTLAANDAFASPWLLRHGLTDYSVVLKLLRRAYGQRLINDRTAELRGSGDLDGDRTLVPTLRAMLVDFAARSRAKGQKPVVLLFEDRGYDGVLRRTLVPTLVANHIPYVLSADIAPASDAGIFLPDGHFLPRIDSAIASRTLPLIQQAAGQ